MLSIWTLALLILGLVVFLIFNYFFKNYTKKRKQGYSIVGIKLVGTKNIILEFMDSLTSTSNRIEYTVTRKKMSREKRKEAKVNKRFVMYIQIYAHDLHRFKLRVEIFNIRIGEPITVVY